MTPEPMAPEVSCLHPTLFHRWLSLHFPGEEFIEPVISAGSYLATDPRSKATVPVTEKYILDKSNWMSNELSIQLFRRAAHIIGGDQPLRRIGREIYQSRATGWVGSLLRLSAFNPRVLIDRFASSAEKFNVVKVYELTLFDGANNRWVMRNWRKDPDKTALDPLICQYNLGGLEGATSWWGNNVSARHTSCECKGDPYCEFELSWQPRRWTEILGPQNMEYHGPLDSERTHAAIRSGEPSSKSRTLADVSSMSESIDWLHLEILGDPVINDDRSTTQFAELFGGVSNQVTIILGDLSMTGIGAHNLLTSLMGTVSDRITDGLPLGEIAQEMKNISVFVAPGCRLNTSLVTINRADRSVEFFGESSQLLSGKLGRPVTMETTLDGSPSLVATITD